MSQPARFSVVIPTCHRNELLARCLAHLAPGRQEISADRYEVIVTDDGSRSTSESLLKQKFPWVRWTQGPRQGPAANRNHGAELASHEWIAFADDDCEPDPGWLAAYADAAQKLTGIAALEGVIRTDRPRRSLAESAPLNNQGGKLWSCNFAVRRDAFHSVGGFDERFPFAAMEDVDFARRLSAAGHSIAFIKDASVCHPWRPRGGWRACKRHQQSTLIYLDLHPAERERINSRHYLRIVAALLKHEFIPGIINFRGRGAWCALAEYACWLQTAAILLLRKPGRIPAWNEYRQNRQAKVAAIDAG